MSGKGFTREEGMASFMVTTALIMVISLIIIGFSQVAHRNQREALDRQLSTQAFYAAESGVNEAVAVVQKQVALGKIPPEKTNCDPHAAYPEVKPNGEDVKVTCLLVRTNIDNLYYQGVTENSPTVIPLVSADGRVISKVTITWQNPVAPGNPADGCVMSGVTSLTLPQRGGWGCKFGLLRADIAPMPNGSISTAMSTFFYPTKYTAGALNENSANTISYSSKGGLDKGYCVNTDKKCMVSIDGLNQAEYYLSLRSIYIDSDVKIRGYDTNGGEVDFKGQVLIDSTAKAQDVLRRIQVRVPLKPQKSTNLPAYAIETTDSVCKRFAVEPGYYAADPAVPCP